MHLVRSAAVDDVHTVGSALRGNMNRGEGWRPKEAHQWVHSSTGAQRMPFTLDRWNTSAISIKCRRKNIRVQNQNTETVERKSQLTHVSEEAEEEQKEEGVRHVHRTNTSYIFIRNSTI